MVELLKMLKHLDPRTKIIFSLSISILAISLDQWFSLLSLSIFASIMFLIAGPRYEHLKLTFFFVGLTLWGLVVSQGIFYQEFPRHVILTLVPSFELCGHRFNGLFVYKQGLYYGAIQGLRLISSILVGMALCLSTTPDRIFLGLIKLRIPYGLAFLAVTAVRFLPIVAEEIKSVRLAMRIKGYRPLKCGLKQTIVLEINSILPILSRAVRRAHEVTESLLVRGFDPLFPRTWFQDLNWPIYEKVLVGSFLLFALAIALIKILFWLYLQEILYIPVLRDLYGFARNYL